MSANRSRRVAFLLAQIGSDASTAFEQEVSAIGITASEAGLIRLIGRNPGISQKTASDRLGVGPSRIVALLDRLEADGRLQRRRSALDRRAHELTLSPEGQELLARLRPIAETHERAFTAPLSDEDLDTFASYLETIAASRGLNSELHSDTDVR